MQLRRLAALAEEGLPWATKCGEHEVATRLPRNTIFLVDGDAAAASALAPIFQDGGYDVRAFQSAQQFLNEHDPAIPGCAIVDVTLPDGSGLEIQRQLSREGVERPVIFLVATCTIAISVQAMKAGAIDFLTKPARGDQLLRAVQRAIEHDARIRRAREYRASSDGLLASLTEREREVLTHVMVGRLNKQIAAVIGITEKTVKVHRGNMVRKLGVRNVAELVRFSLQAGLLPEFPSAMASNMRRLAGDSQPTSARNSPTAPRISIIHERRHPWQ